MDDVKLALLGDRAAQERITARGELLPCPWCGSNKILKNGYLDCSVWYFCRNVKCNASGPEAQNESDAILAWNTRAPILSAEELEVLKDGK